MVIYVDMDGVIADFNAWAAQYIDTTDQGAYMRLFINNYKSCFRDLAPIVSGLKLLATLKDACILTAMPNHSEFIATGKELGFSEEELERRYNVMRRNKMDWLSKYVGDIPVIIVPTRKDKAKFAAGNILIDDYYANVDDWRRNGGCGVVFTA